VVEDAKLTKEKEKAAIKALKYAINEIASRHNYGIESAATVGVDAPAGATHPAGLCIWRWEIELKDEYLGNSFSPEVLAKIKAREAERDGMKLKAVELVMALDQDARSALFEKRKKAAAGEEGEAAESKESKAKAKELDPEVRERACANVKTDSAFAGASRGVFDTTAEVPKLRPRAESPAEGREGSRASHPQSRARRRQDQAR
jgi:hypothetical protein